MDEHEALIEIATLRHPRTIRERAEALYALALAGELAHFAVDETALDAVTERVVRRTLSAYPDPARIPYHSRFRHFDAGGVPRLAELERSLAQRSTAERLRALGDAVVTSVLLDAGAGTDWRYTEAETGLELGRSEGLAVASFCAFGAGALSDDPARRPFAADASRLVRLTEADVAAWFQVSAENPLVGLAGRAGLLRRLGEVALATPHYFGREQPSPGGLLVTLYEHHRDAELTASHVLAAVLDALGPIWPGREQIAGINLGDVWPHPRVGRVPFHKLSQWLTYSLCEALERSGVGVSGIEELTGLAEYRNGGLFVDGDVLRPRHERVLADVHAVGSEVVVEWRALTIALLDRTAERVRRRLGFEASALPLAKVLEGGTWSAGRELARELRPDGGPPLRVASDGTVF